MTRSNLIAPMLGAALLLSIGACTTRENVVVREAPPDRVEVITPQPSPAHVWIRGRWERHGSEFVWIEGRWERH
jgi:hypothetical protein